jgi:two-component system, OmpR family, phosphate regulon sensor histidine kinase PhoR
MNAPRLQDVSLYELALSSDLPPYPLQISPTIFKSMVSTVIDLLINEKIPATLWLKLPRGDAWQAEIDRYQKSATTPYAIYILSNHKEEEEVIPAPKEVVDALLETEAIERNPFEPTFVDDQGVMAAIEASAKTVLLPLAAETRLRREYFLLVVTQEFSNLMLAHRPRSGRSAKSDAELPELQIATKNSPTDEELERKHPLLGLCSFDPSTIERVLQGVGQAIALGNATPELKTAATAALSQFSPASLNPLLLSYFFSYQIQRQESIWHSSAAYRKQAEAASHFQLEHETLLNALRLKDEFLKHVGQELRTPLTTMKTALTLLNSPTLKPAQRQRYMEMLSHECDRQSSLITSVLDLVQLEEVTDQSPMQPLRLTDAVPGVVSTYQPLAQEKGIMLAYTIPEDLPAVSCLGSWLRQIVINLLHNGIKFTPSGGKVWVKAKQQGDFVEIEFRDTGIGIAPGEIPKIFDRFYRVRQNPGEDSGGAGLGLSIVQQLLLRCGGSISVRSKPSEGAIFSVLLPIYR